MQIDFNTKILGQLLYKHTDRVGELTRKYPKILEWEKEKDKPTLKQLAKLAVFFHVPFGYFFLDELPQIKYPIPHYRNGARSAFKPSDELLATIRIIEERQQWAKELRKEFMKELPYVGSLTLNTNIKRAAQKIRELLKLSVHWSEVDIILTWEDAFRYLKTKVEDAGIFVAINGVVNNDTGRKLNVDEFRGFVLHDKYAPFIFINNNDFVYGKIFTIIHEVVHVLLGKSASFENKDLLPANDEIEKFCDAVAAEFLVPETLLNDQFERFGVDYEKLAKEFKVSRIVVARRLYDLKKIRKADFYSVYNNYKGSNIEKKKKEGEGGNFFYLAQNRIGRSFFNLIYSAVRQDKILYRDAFKITSLTPKTFDSYVKKFIE
jgi:Zn-dependent peptidase ImmA (M78 family)